MSRKNLNFALENKESTFSLLLKLGKETELPQELFELTNLIELQITGKKLESLQGLEKLRNLKRLKCKETAVTELSKLPSQLQTLTIQKTLLTDISSVFEHCHDLKEMNVSSNKIETLPETISNCASLTRLVLDQNLLQDLPRSLKKCIKLAHLSVDGNPLTESAKTWLQEDFHIWFD